MEAFYSYICDFVSVHLLLLRIRAERYDYFGE